MELPITAALCRTVRQRIIWLEEELAGCRDDDIQRLRSLERKLNEERARLREYDTHK